MDLKLSSSDGTPIVVRRIGRGAPVVALHGSGGGLGSWDLVAARLADAFEFWVPARRGHAPSGSTEGKTFADEVADVDAVLAMIAPDRGPVHLLGGSAGGIVALHAAVSGDARIRSLAVFEPPLFSLGPTMQPVLDGVRASLQAGDINAASQLFTERVARVPAALMAALDAARTGTDAAESLRATIGACSDLEAFVTDADDLDRWSAISVPTLLLGGTETWEPIPSTLDRLAAVLPQASRVWLQGQSHFATHTAPDLFAGELERFWTTDRR